MNFGHLQRYVRQRYPIPQSYYGVGREKFQRMVYHHWAAEEVLKCLKIYGIKYWIEILEDLRSTADTYCCMASTDSTKNVFLSLYDVTTDLLDYMIWNGGNL